MVNDPYAYPDADFIANKTETYACLPEATRTLYNNAWVEIVNG